MSIPESRFSQFINFRKNNVHIKRLTTVTRLVQWRNKFQLVHAPSLAKQNPTSTCPVVGEQFYNLIANILNSTQTLCSPYWPYYAACISTMSTTQTRIINTYVMQCWIMMIRRIYCDTNLYINLHLIYIVVMITHLSQSSLNFWYVAKKYIRHQQKKLTSIQTKNKPPTESLTVSGWRRSSISVRHVTASWTLATNQQCYGKITWRKRS